jgi:hypothetical protein
MLTNVHYFWTASIVLIPGDYPEQKSCQEKDWPQIDGIDFDQTANVTFFRNLPANQLYTVVACAYNPRADYFSPPVIKQITTPID